MMYIIILETGYNIDMSGKKVLIVDDEADILKLLEYNLQREGFIALTASSGIDALEILRKEEIDLVVLDLMLPEMDGYEVLRLMKSNRELSDIAVIMLTAKSEEIDKILGLELGADDYVTKPFSPRELIARIKAVLRRADKLKEEKSTLKGLIIDKDRYEVLKDGKKIELSAREFKLLNFLASSPGRVYTRDRLLDEVWGDEVFVEPRTVDVHIRRLREKIEDNPSRPKYIKTKRGIGYYFKEDEQ